jgi:formylglycine-generating enzyme required for sulfatase activity
MKVYGLLLLAILFAPLTAEAEARREGRPPQLVKIEAGIFSIGSPVTEISRNVDEAEQQGVISGFYMGNYEVTQREYEAVTGTNPSRFQSPDLPVEQVSWFDALLYCNARSVKEGLRPVYTIDDKEIVWDHSADGYRLPTEAEWEYACRAGSRGPFYTGNSVGTDKANFDGSRPYNNTPAGKFRQMTTQGGTFAPNAWGLYDMHGNVSEWCWDQYRENRDEELDGSLRMPAIIKGGAWDSEARFLRSASRGKAEHAARASSVGFRVVRSIL